METKVRRRPSWAAAPVPALAAFAWGVSVGRFVPMPWSFVVGAASMAAWVALVLWWSVGASPAADPGPSERAS